MQSFYYSTVESVLTYSITVWYAGLTAEDRTALRGVIKSAHKIIGHPLPAQEDIADPQGLNRAKMILHDPTHLGQSSEATDKQV